jgi:hypothetical protein
MQQSTFNSSLDSQNVWLQVLGISDTSLPQLAFTALPEYAVVPLPQTPDKAAQHLRDFQAGQLKLSVLR